MQAMTIRTADGHRPCAKSIQVSYLIRPFSSMNQPESDINNGMLCDRGVLNHH